MDKKIQESVGTLLAHIIKVDHRDIEKEAPVFCDIMKHNFTCTEEEAKKFLYRIVDTEYNLDDHIEVLNQALKDDRIAKLHLLEQLNHVIYSDKISANDYKIFEEIKNRLFPE